MEQRTTCPRARSTSWMRRRRLVATAGLALGLTALAMPMATSAEPAPIEHHIGTSCTPDQRIVASLRNNSAPATPWAITYSDDAGSEYLTGTVTTGQFLPFVFQVPMGFSAYAALSVDGVVVGHASFFADQCVPAHPDPKPIELSPDLSCVDGEHRLTVVLESTSSESITGEVLMSSPSWSTTKSVTVPANGVASLVFLPGGPGGVVTAGELVTVSMGGLATTRTVTSEGCAVEGGALVDLEAWVQCWDEGALVMVNLTNRTDTSVTARVRGWAPDHEAIIEMPAGHDHPLLHHVATASTTVDVFVDGHDHLDRIGLEAAHCQPGVDDDSGETSDDGDDDGGDDDGGDDDGGAGTDTGGEDGDTDGDPATGGPVVVVDSSVPGAPAASQDAEAPIPPTAPDSPPANGDLVESLPAGSPAGTAVGIWAATTFPHEPRLGRGSVSPSMPSPDSLKPLPSTGSTTAMVTAALGAITLLAGSSMLLATRQSSRRSVSRSR